MVDQPLLHRRILRAYEIGRFGMALRVLFWLLPLTAVCLAISHRPLVCAAVATVLAIAAVALRWRDRAGIEQVKLGLLTGIAPLVVALGVGRLEALTGKGLGCALICVVSAVVAGLWLGTHVAEQRRRLSAWLTVIVIASAAASLGCLDLGLSGMLGVALGIAVASSVSASRPRLPA